MGVRSYTFRYTGTDPRPFLTELLQQSILKSRGSVFYTVTHIVEMEKKRTLDFDNWTELKWIWDMGWKYLVGKWWRKCGSAFFLFSWRWSRDWGTTGGDTVAVPVGVKGGGEIGWKIGIFADTVQLECVF